MTKEGTQFSYDPPEGWAESTEGKRSIFTGPKGEEFMVMSWVVEGEGPADELAGIVEEIRKNAVNAAESAASSPGYAVVSPLTEGGAGCVLSHWTIEARSKEQGTLLLEAVVSGPRGAILATLEGPEHEGMLRIFGRFLKGVRLSG